MVRVNVDRLDQALAAMGITRTGLQDRMDIAHGTMQRITSGLSISHSTQQRLHAALGGSVPVTELFELVVDDAETEDGAEGEAA